MLIISAEAATTGRVVNRMCVKPQINWEIWLQSVSDNPNGNTSINVSSAAIMNNN